MGRKEVYICDVCKSARAGVIEIAPGYGNPSQEIDVCAQCMQAVSWLLRTPEGGRQLRLIAHERETCDLPGSHPFKR